MKASSEGQMEFGCVLTETEDSATWVPYERVVPDPPQGTEIIHKLSHLIPPYDDTPEYRAGVEKDILDYSHAIFQCLHACYPNAQIRFIGMEMQRCYARPPWGKYRFKKSGPPCVRRIVTFGVTPNQQETRWVW